LTHDTRVTDPAVGAVIAFPLGCRGRRVGALVALDRQPSARDPQMAPSMLRAVRMLLEPASVALDNALLLKRAEALSVTDDLTHLYNSRYLNLVLRRETKRASRSGRPLSLLFIDLDGFKTVNDTHGHLIGSKLLAEIGYLIKAQLRLIDFAFRYGGDEFVVLLPQTGKDQALVVAHRLRDSLRASCFCKEEGLNLNVRASMGLATYPHDAKSPHDIIRQADEMMYMVKNSTRDNIGIAQRGIEQ